MRPDTLRLPAACIAAGLCLAVAASACRAGVIGRDLERAMAMRGTYAETAVIVRFSDTLDFRTYAVGDRRTRDNRLLVALKARAARNRAAIESLLAELKAVRIKDLWIINGLAATLPAVAVSKLAAHPRVARVELDSFVQGARSQRTPPSRASQRRDGEPLPVVPPAPENDSPSPRAKPGWNVEAIHAPELWARGVTGKGVVVATMDTGADLGHPDLRHAWRGGTNSWFDPHGEEPSPYDALGHGTQALGVILAQSGLGIAPDARWISVRLYDSAGRSSMSDIHRAFQWLMDPDGDPATVDAPDVVNASWALTGRVHGTCVLEFNDDLRALRSAGIAVIFAAGNDGPMPNTSDSPGNNPGTLSVGAVNRHLRIARQTSRGPSACDGSVFPRLVAPGVDIRTTDLSHGGTRSYTRASGSSMAAPHAAGVIALLAGAFPSASVAELEDALQRGAKDLGRTGSDNRYGYGLTDALAAYEVLRSMHASGGGTLLTHSFPSNVSNQH